ncbi:hypothetical protein AT15_02825 [Kosmotoga arenicorallina S304]|uniref:L-serine ammonia-lyase n=1 Tax=Kosmotoga arenicorallina S304 TaxID=1453497 RepID=A0A176K3T8_9BACT|nr:serine dehydratase beta chain [Kosmotoga arenicorallina]OAA31777.1 hypothetical protein AT15_02825 [Kosmotoga arenicorallina S304]
MILDVIGPIIIGPSSSHTAGMVRLGRTFRYLFNHSFSKGESLKRVEFYLNKPLFSSYKGHGTDRALVGGVLGYFESQEEIRSSIEIASSLGLDIVFYCKSFENSHPNMVMISGNSDSEAHYLIGASTGGASIEILEIDGAPMNISGTFPTLIIKNSDTPGALSKIVGAISMKKLNISNMFLVRTNRLKGEATCIVELDDVPEGELISLLEKLEPVLSVSYLPPITTAIGVT